MNGNPASEVLYKASANGMDLYVTNTGLTFVTYEYNNAPAIHPKDVQTIKNQETRANSIEFRKP